MGLNYHNLKKHRRNFLDITGILMIQKKQIIGANDNVSTFENFAILMAR
ncbi:hypothetical protein IYZ83_001305 [Wolbachia pipientis]|nr:hypothetical protein [Wolbachia pipientis]UIP91878.1 hypothetical protein IYZ83_001305 [Wolbachia pipientis]